MTINIIVWICESIVTEMTKPDSTEIYNFYLRSVPQKQLQERLKNVSARFIYFSFVLSMSFIHFFPISFKLYLLLWSPIFFFIHSLWKLSLSFSYSIQIRSIFLNCLRFQNKDKMLLKILLTGVKTCSQKKKLINTSGGEPCIQCSVLKREERGRKIA